MIMLGGITGLEGRLSVRLLGRGGRRKGWLCTLREWERKLREPSWDGGSKLESLMASGVSDKRTWEKNRIFSNWLFDSRQQTTLSSHVVNETEAAVNGSRPAKRCGSKYLWVLLHEPSESYNAGTIHGPYFWPSYAISWPERVQLDFISDVNAVPILL